MLKFLTNPDTWPTKSMLIISFEYTPRVVMVMVVGFSSLGRIWVEGLTVHFMPALFSFLFLFFFVVVSSGDWFPLTNSTLYTRIGPSGSATWDDCGRVLSDDLCLNSFPDRFSHYARTVAESAHPDFVGSRVYASLDVTCHLHSWQNGRSLLCATALTRGWNAHRIRVSTKS